MDEWDSVREKISELEGSLHHSTPEVISTLESISVADFWKRRHEEDRRNWEDKLAAKEKEQLQVREKYLEDERGIRELDFKVQLLEERLKTEKLIWQETSKVKLLEAELEKKKVEWEAKVKMIEDENDRLKEKIYKGIETTEEEIKRRQQIELEKMKMAEETKALQSKVQAMVIESDRKSIQIESEKMALQKQMETLKSSKSEGKEKSVEIEKELTSLNEERARHLAEMEEKEKEHLESFEDLARGFAHKVRNYLGVISGTIQLCLVNYKLEEELKSQVLMVDENAQEMLKAIEEYLNLAKIPIMTFEAVNPNELLSSIIASSEEQARARNVVIEKKFSDGLPKISIDRAIFQEGIKNILENAVEASQGGKTISVGTRFDSETKSVLILISDSGKGISENHLKKVFQPYFSNVKGKKGMGLPIAKRMFSLNRGTITLSSTKNQGTTATIRIPSKK